MTYSELFNVISTKLVVENCVNVDDYAVLSCLLNHGHKALLGSVLGRNSALLVKFSKIPEVVDIIANRR